MKTRLLTILSILGSLAPCLGEGSINVSNRSLHNEASGESYHIPIWVDLNANGTFDDGEGIGSYAAALGQFANFALYVENDPTPIATSVFRSDINGAFLGQPVFQSVFVRGYNAGQRAPLHIEVWVGASFQNASVRGYWNFLSRPLGGAPADGGVPIIPPGLEGWGTPNGAGFPLATPPGPVAGTDFITRGSFSDARVSVETLLANDADASGGPVTFVRVDPRSNGGAGLTFANGEIVYHQANPGPDFFFYAIRNSAGGVSRGRVDVVINDLEGMIVFGNEKIPLPAGDGFYDVPIFVDADFDGSAAASENFGDFAATYYSQPAQLGLFLKGNTTPLATAPFGSGAKGIFIAPPIARTIVIPVAPPGSTVDLTVKAWIGRTFETSRVKGSWDITSLPLGGVVAGGPTFPIPGLTGWGDAATGAGYLLSPGAKPVAGDDEVTRKYREDVTINIATLLANDVDPEGGTVTLIGVDSISNDNASISRTGTTITYHRNTEADDYFSYTIRASHGASSKGRVNIKAGEAIGEIIFSNYNIPKASGTGTYNVPIFVDYNTNGVFDMGEDIASFATVFGKTATLGLYQQGSNQPITTVQLRKPSDKGGVPVGTVIPPAKLTSITFTVGTGSGLEPGTIYTATFTSDGRFTAVNVQGDAMGTGTYVYTPDFSNNTAHLRLNYPDLPGDFDDVTLSFTTTTGPNAFAGTQGVGATLYPFPGTFTFVTEAAPQPLISSILVPGYRPGEQAALTIKVWVGESFDSATVKKAWDFTSLPLGGPSPGGTNIPAPGLTGWGEESGKGFALDAGPSLIVGSDVIRIPERYWIPISVLLPNDSDPTGGSITVINVDPVSENGATVVLSGSIIYFQNTSIGADTFGYRVLSSSGGVGSGSVHVMVDPCNDCGDGGDGGEGSTTGEPTSTTGGPGPGVAPAVIIVSNYQVHRSNSSGAYNIPIWVDANFNGRRDAGEGIGTFANQSGQTASLGLFLPNATTPITTARFHSNSRGAFLENPEYQTVHIPGGTPGSAAQLTLKAWIGANYESASVKAAWDYTSPPLGWGQDIIGIPELSGWGEEINSSGYAIFLGVKPKTYGTVLTRAPGQNVNTKLADMMKNDSDPEGGALTLVAVDESSREGGGVTVVGDTVYYAAPLQDSGAADYFEYTVRNSKGGIAKGRVDVVVTDAQGQFNTRVAIETLPDGNHISFRGVVGGNYGVQFSDGIDGEWKDLGSAVDEGFGLFKINDSGAGDLRSLLNDPVAGGLRFYRILSQH